MSEYWKEQALLQKAAFVEDVKAFLSINSIEDMTTATAGKPFGEGVAAALESLLARGAQDGFWTKNLDGYAGTIELGDGEEEVGVLVHIDVVTVGEGWTTPPFEPTIRDGRLYARGALDDKGPALAAYYALRLVRDSGLALTKRVRLIIGTDEESGWLCMKHFMEHDRVPPIGFSPDSSFPMTHAEKGQINPTLTIAPTQGSADGEGRLRLLSFVSGDQGNSVPDKAEAVVCLGAAAGEQLALAQLASQWEQFLQEKATSGRMEQLAPDRLKFTVAGKPAHGMAPEEGVNAGTLLACFLRERSFEGSASSFLSLLSDIIHEDYYGQRLQLACEDDVSGKLTVNAGILRYSETDGGSVRLNIRYPATISCEEYVEKLKKRVAELGWTIDSLRTSKSHYVPKDHPVIQTLSKVYEEHTGQPATLLSSGGATYAKIMPYGVAFGPLFPGKESTAHLIDEYVEIDDLLRAMAIYAHAIYELAR
ncbi:dipeptidase PepV [Brevibacillus agri]|uniref:Dipeptidase PepV n=1 Tax=Brevibacillus agri TaxID=51101 RepID=A0A3M8BAL0_9BACL|nr:dipeptidase PepV [Brevibacillus agri]ELK40381.1 peptidase [Brevibacillus agri BAB-2500]MBG9564174.1 peptidase [Brevibacillus agri]MBY0053467.1 dipeptidase PepV [Brevibacillus agri]MDN4093890.1 dipeptidase PepV [Brevibacillus agri]MED1644001.1 dipeptidase PepV [Brevibacillus agri]